MAEPLYWLHGELCGVHARTRKGFVTIPMGVPVSIVERPRDSTLMTVNWEGNELLVFAQDFDVRTTAARPNRGRDAAAYKRRLPHSEEAIRPSAAHSGS